jgi:hypothetical protein
MVIFISYRRGSSSPLAGRLDDRLRARFGPKAVFRDVDNIPPGVDFQVHLSQAVMACDVFLPVIGPDFFGERIHDPGDFVRIEIEAALRLNKAIIPVLVGNTDLPSPTALPPSVAPLLRRNAVIVDVDRRFDDAVRYLIRGIEAAGPAGGRRPWRSMLGLPSLGLAGVVLVGGVLLLARPRPGVERLTGARSDSNKGDGAAGRNQIANVRPPETLRDPNNPFLRHDSDPEPPLVDDPAASPKPAKPSPRVGPKSIDRAAMKQVIRQHEPQTAACLREHGSDDSANFWLTFESAGTVRGTSGPGVGAGLHNCLLAEIRTWRVPPFPGPQASIFWTFKLKPLQKILEESRGETRDAIRRPTH